MLMTKFGKFKLRLIATINMSVLLSVFNLASTTSNYWIKYVDHLTGESHYAGMWRSCPEQGPCVWKNGIISNSHSFWSIFVRFMITIGTVLNLFTIGTFLVAFIYKINKKSRWAITWMEWGNWFMIISFIFSLVGFTTFISATTSFSLWLHVLAMIFIIISSNQITRTFAHLYFSNTRSNQASKSVEAAICEDELKMAPIAKDAITNTEANINAITTIEMNKEKCGSNEALITPAVVSTVTEVNTTPVIAVMDVTSTNTCATQEVQPTA